MIRFMLAIAGAIALLASGIALAASYEYDALGRLTKVTYDDGAYVEYAYDENGNRTSVTGIDADGNPPGVGAVIVVPLNGFTVIPLQ